MKTKGLAKRRSMPSKHTDFSNEFEGLLGFEEIPACNVVKIGKDDRISSTLISNSKIVKKKKKRKKKINPKHFLEASVKPSYDRVSESKRPAKESVDVSAWTELFVVEPILSSLARLGFSTPTEIQRLTLPAAICKQRDIIGAAETGSGKTLAFGIPIVQGILKDKEQEKTNGSNNNGLNESHDSSDDENHNSDEPEDDQADELKSDTGEDPSKVEVEEDISMDGSSEACDEDSFESLNMSGTKSLRSKGKCRALIVTPTRELAIQVKDHLAEIIQGTDIKLAVVVGGMSQQKQERLLNKAPDIVVGTPGRLWKLVQEGNHLLSRLPYIKYLAVDETDRMVEKGHFEELKSLLSFINSDESGKKYRQTFTFSATLSLVHSVPRFKTSRKKIHRMTSEMKLENLTKEIGMKGNPKVVDITKKIGTVDTLSEAKIHCCKESKDYYLYYLLKEFPGRMLVFCNSIDCVRRLQSLFSHLQCSPKSLHASMEQKQRLRSLEAFGRSNQALLIATDVAARGLDIPSIDHVIHYQVPRTAESYIHRSGRTARASNEGLSVLLIDSSEQKLYQQLCTTLNRSQDLTPFPTDERLMRVVKERVSQARLVDNLEHSMWKESAQSSWLKKIAEEAELQTDESEMDDEDRATADMAAAKRSRMLRNNKALLAELLARPLSRSQFSVRYPTQDNRLSMMQAGALSRSDPSEKRGLKNALVVLKKEKLAISECQRMLKPRKDVVELRMRRKKLKDSEKRRLKREKRKREVRKRQKSDDSE